MIIRNPRTRAPSEQALLRAAAPLRALGWHVEVYTTQAAGDATGAARQAAEGGASIVAACGGDGTVREVAVGLLGTQAALAVLPAGTANIWAREARVPRDARAALQMLPWSRQVAADLGTVNGAPFLLMCSAGIDAETVRRVGLGRAKRWFGRGAYLATGARTMLRAPAVRARITVDAEVFERDLLMAVAGNTRLYGGAAWITRHARIDDGLLDLCAFAGAGLRHRAALAARALRRDLRDDGGDGVDYVRGAAISIETERPLAVQADGEYVGETPIELGVLPAALNVLLAPQPNPLLGE